jgi:hypothetical protein
MDDELADAEIQSPDQITDAQNQVNAHEERRNSFGDRNFIEAERTNEEEGKKQAQDNQNHKYALI